MNEKNNNNFYLSLKELLSEILLRDLILFVFIFLLIISQIWENIFLLLFPIMTFTFSLFFRILSSNKMKTEFNNNPIIYNPLGLERKNANRLFYCTLFQLILIFWIGADFIFLYTFSFFWIFIDSWKYTKIKIITKSTEERLTGQFSKDLGNLISFLKVNDFRMVIYAMFFVFIILNILNIIILLFTDYSSIGIQLVLPGSQILTLSYLSIKRI